MDLVGRWARLPWMGMRRKVQVGGIPSCSSSWTVLAHGTFPLHVDIVVWGRHGGWCHLILKGGSPLDSIASRLHHVWSWMAVVIVGTWDRAPWWLRLELQRLPRDIVTHHGPVLLQTAWISLLLGSWGVHSVGWVPLGSHHRWIGAHTGRATHWVSHGSALCRTRWGHHVVHYRRRAHIGSG